MDLVVDWVQVQSDDMRYVRAAEHVAGWLFGMLSILIRLNKASQDEHMNQMIRQRTYETPTSSVGDHDLVLTVST